MAGNETLTHNDTWEPTPGKELSAYALILTWLGGCTSNVYVIYLGLTAWRINRKPLTMFLVSLACVDFLTCFLLIPYSVTNKLLPFSDYARGSWIGKIFCEVKIMETFSTVLVTGGIWHDLLIAYNRFLATSLDIFEYPQRFTLAKCKSFLAKVYGIAVIMGSARLISSLNALGSNTTEMAKFNCIAVTNGKNGSAIKDIATMIIFLVFTIIPVVTSIGFLCAVVYMLYKGTALSISDRNWTKTAVTLLTLKGLLIMPYIFCNTLNLSVFGLDVSEGLIASLKDVMILNCVVTPFVYGLRLREFTQASPRANNGSVHGERY